MKIKKSFWLCQFSYEADGKPRGVLDYNKVPFPEGASALEDLLA